MTHRTVTLELDGTYPRRGPASILIRCEESDKEIIDAAAVSLGIRQAEFTRMILIAAAKKIIEGNAS